MSHRYLARLQEQLAQTADVYSIDLPGFGGLPKPAGDLSIPDMSRALSTVLHRLGLRDVTLVGHSMGAQWVTELAACDPGAASTVILIGPVTDGRHATVRAQAAALGVDTLGEPLSGNVLAFADYARCGPRWYLAQVRHMVAYRTDERLATLRSPVLIIRGGDDPIAGMAWARRLRDRARRASLVIIPGHRHLAQFSAPRAVADAIVAFLHVGAGSHPDDPRGALP